MRIAEENWKVLASLFPAGWQQAAWQSGAVERLRGFPSPDVLLRMLLLHVARGYSLRETVVRANWRTGLIFRMSPCSKCCRGCEA
jgi:hypothetical protein